MSTQQLMIKPIKRLAEIAPSECTLTDGVGNFIYVSMGNFNFTIDISRTISEIAYDRIQCSIQRAIEAREWEWFMSSELAEKGRSIYCVTLSHIESAHYADSAAEALLALYVEALEMEDTLGKELGAD